MPKKYGKTQIDHLILAPMGPVAYKMIYKFRNGKLIKEFKGWQSAAFHAGVTIAGLSNYINKKIKKPRTIPDHIEYSCSADESQWTKEKVGDEKEVG